MAKAQSKVSEFLLDLIPGELRVACEVLDGLDYPINDMRSLNAEVSELGLLRALQPTDFPLASGVNAFEKLRYRLPAVFPSFSGPELTVPDEGWGEPPETTLERYVAWYGQVCGHNAYEAYMERRRAGIDHYRAEAHGDQVGRQCVLGRTLWEWRPPAPRFRYP